MAVSILFLHQDFDADGYHRRVLVEIATGSVHIAHGSAQIANVSVQIALDRSILHGSVKIAHGSV
jgi:hypothetical protein